MNRKKNKGKKNHPKNGNPACQTTVPPAAPMFDVMPSWKPMTPPTRAAMVAMRRVNNPRMWCVLRSR